MGKHAYLIIAHNKFEQLKMLCEMLDFEQNDIYMHIDAQVTDFDADTFRPALRHSKMKFAERTRVNWGGYSQIQAELNLLKAAANSGEDYSYYHLLSGADLPLRPAQEHLLPTERFRSMPALPKFLSIRTTPPHGSAQRRTAA